MLIIGADHAGFKLKESIKNYLKKTHRPYQDVGIFSEAPVDYPDVAQKAAQLVKKSNDNKGILVCASGGGMAIAANKVKGIRAVSCESVICAKKSRRDDDANILALGAKIISQEKANRILATWLNTKASKAKRHRRRIKKISKLED